MNSNLKPIVLIVVGNYLPGFKAGGILRSVANIIEHLHGRFDFLVVTRDRDVGDFEPFSGVVTGQWVPVGHSKVYYLSPRQHGSRELAAIVAHQRYDLLYLNSFFEPLCIRLLFNMRIGRIQPRPVVVAPRGEFAWASLRLKYPKKRLFIALARLTGLFKGVKWHAANAGEAAEISAMMRPPATAIVVAPDLPAPERADDPLSAPAPGDESADGLAIVFLARISPEKNLDFVLRVLSNVRIRATLDIIGPLENHAYWQACQPLIDQLPRNVTVRYIGTVQPSEVMLTLARYDLMFFPSGGESYGHVIAEAMRVGTPVLTSMHTPWRDLETRGLGWDLPLEAPAAFVQRLEQFAQLDRASRDRLRVAAREAARSVLDGTQAKAAHARMFFDTLGVDREPRVEVSGSDSPRE